MTWLCQPFLKHFRWHFSCWIELDLKAGTGTWEEVRNTSNADGCRPTGTKANGFNTEYMTKHTHTHMTDYTYNCVSLLGYPHEYLWFLSYFFPHVYLKYRADIILIFYRKEFQWENLVEKRGWIIQPEGKRKNYMGRPSLTRTLFSKIVFIP